MKSLIIPICSACPGHDSRSIGGANCAYLCKADSCFVRRSDLKLFSEEDKLKDFPDWCPLDDAKTGGSND